MRADGGTLLRLSSSAHALLQRTYQRVTGLRFGGPDLGARFALIIFGIAAITVTRSVSFLYAVPDRKLPPIPPLLWLFHVADRMFLPGGSRLPSLNSVQAVQFISLILALTLFFLAVRATIPKIVRRYYRPLAYAALALASLLAVLNLQGLLPFPIAVGSHHYGNDAVTVTSCGADDFLAGRNPYTSFSVIPCLSKNGQDGTKTTPLQKGLFAGLSPYPPKVQLIDVFNYDRDLGVQHPAEFESYYSYPSVSFMFPAVFVKAHLHDLSVLYLLLYILAAALIIHDAPSSTARKMVVVAVCANAALGPTLLSGSTDALYTLLVLLAWTSRDRPWVSAVAMGVAVASRQQAWFFLAFYLVLVLRTAGWREAWHRLAIVAGVFMATNVPYFAAAPEAWLTGVLGPMRDAMFPRGSGLIALSTGGSGSLPIGPKYLYTVLELTALGSSLVYYWRTCRTSPWTGLVLAPVALFFAWRSLYSYFLPISLLALYPAFVAYARPPGTAEATDPVSVPAADEVAA